LTTNADVRDRVHSCGGESRDECGRSLIPDVNHVNVRSFCVARRLHYCRRDRRCDDGDDLNHIRVRVHVRDRGDGDDDRALS
jgi:hypothetical protein